MYNARAGPWQNVMVLNSLLRPSALFVVRYERVLAQNLAILAFQKKGMIFMIYAPRGKNALERRQ
jgi:hypothetical protein